MLLVASENGYPKVVQQLLEDEELVKIEVDRGAKALFLKYTVHEGNAHDAPRSGFAGARNKVKAKKREYGECLAAWGRRSTRNGNALRPRSRLATNRAMT